MRNGYNGPQVFDSDVLEQTVRSCKVMLNTLSEKRNGLIKTFNTLLDIGLCTDMISDYNAAISNIEYILDTLKEQLSNYSNLIGELEGSSSNMFKKYDVRMNRKSGSTNNKVKVNIDTSVKSLQDSIEDILPESEVQIEVITDSEFAPNIKKQSLNEIKSNISDISDIEFETLIDVDEQSMKKNKSKKSSSSNLGLLNKTYSSSSGSNSSNKTSSNDSYISQKIDEILKSLSEYSSNNKSNKKSNSVSNSVDIYISDGYTSYNNKYKE